MPKNLFTVERDYEHEREQAVGILVANLGTPEAPTAKALRPYLGQFLWDPRVVEYSRPLWWLILNGIILRLRPKNSAKLYANVWTDEGSPLLTVSQGIADGIQQRLAERIGTPVHTVLGMTYGEPSMQRALAELKAANCRRVLVLPLYPHYSSSTVGSVFDAVAKELMTWRWVPELRTIHQYPDRPAFIEALANRVRAHWAEHGEPDRLVTSYHGIPKRYFLNGDPYHCQCHKTTRLLVEELGCDPDKVVVTFQSLFGREEWLKPYTEDTLHAMPGAGIKKVDVICPGFAADCLETIDEIDREYREVFEEAGGEEYRYIPCLNDDDDHIDLLTDLVTDNLGGWVGAAEQRDGVAVEADLQQTADLASALAARCPRADAGLGGSPKA
ncbi:MAG: ferrochelatase [Thermoanaerobaculia bacterium]|nr:ferrochelatase [Thermoanaerobaculia bacterium]